MSEVIPSSSEDGGGPVGVRETRRGQLTPALPAQLEGDSRRQASRYSQSWDKSVRQIGMVRELTSADAVNQFLEDGWLLLSCKADLPNSRYILGRRGIVELDPNVDLPTERLLIPNGASLSEGLLALFALKWAGKPRSLREVRMVFEAYGLFYPKQSVAVALLRLVRLGRLKRSRTEGDDYLYSREENRI